MLDADGQQFLGFLTEGGRRLATLVNDLLAYTRAGMAELDETPVDSSAVLKNSLASLAEAIRESDADGHLRPAARRCTWARRTCSRFCRISSAMH